MATATDGHVLAFGSKAETLERLAPRLRGGHVPPLAWFTVGAWRADRGAVLAHLREALGAAVLLVRSSALFEDGERASHAGEFLTVSGVPGGEREAVASAVDRVIASYGRDSAADQVLVQHQVERVRLAGVLFTRDPETLAPYRIFNYDDRAEAATDAVTAGRRGGLRTYVRLRGAGGPYPSEGLRRVYAAVEELEGLFPHDRLDVELAVDAAGEVQVFQVRPIVTAAPTPPGVEVMADWLDKARRKLAKRMGPHPHLRGTRSVFGVMPDWNPAEIVGLRPRALALSLYRELVTDAIWAYQRHGYGYRDLRSFPLLVSFLGVPFIDVRVCFNSFVPAGVRDGLADRLVNHYVDALVRSPHLHDKVEFEIVHSCYYPGIRGRLAHLEGEGFTGTELGELLAELRVLTHRVIHPRTGLYRADLDRVQRLDARRRAVLGSQLSPVDAFYWLIEDCKRYGTLPFSGLARAAFIATQFLDSFVREGVLEPGDRESFMRSLNTVTQRMTADLARLGGGALPRDEFLEAYGHLRPGTYDLLSPRYDEAPDHYLGRDLPSEVPPPPPPFVLPPSRGRAMASLLSSEGIEAEPGALLEFCREAIEGREQAKLVFTRSLSDALVQVEALGRRVGLDREAMSHVDARTLLGLYASLDALDLREFLERAIEANRQAYAVTRAVRLPHLILDPSDVLAFHLSEGEPNFVGSSRVCAEVVREAEFRGRSLEGRICLIASADPGYDWIFSRRIAGLVTQFGGANSHMAVRAAEQGIPAVIGCGEPNFLRWGAARVLDLDCACRRVTVLR
ncbi:MAG: phosphoenolpyruvate synthase [Planctomycetes bacterium]|nr:phosphoenolpyruvate synthase [Planctomycetota bacterium]